MCDLCSVDFQKCIAKFIPRNAEDELLSLVSTYQVFRTIMWLQERISRTSTSESGIPVECSNLL
jgi:hypothetical protein